MPYLRGRLEHENLLDSLSLCWPDSTQTTFGILALLEVEHLAACALVLHVSVPGFWELELDYSLGGKRVRGIESGGVVPLLASSPQNQVAH